MQENGHSAAQKVPEEPRSHAEEHQRDRDRAPTDGAEQRVDAAQRRQEHRTGKQHD